MDEKTYKSILETLASVPVTAMPCVKLLGDRFGVGPETIHSIYSQEVQYRVKKTHSALCEASVGLMKDYVLGMHSSFTCHFFLLGWSITNAMIV